MKKLLLTTLLVIQSSFTFSQDQLLDEIVAVVEEGVILRSDLDKAITNILQQFKARGTQIPPKSVLDKQVLERLITQELQIQKADLAGVRISDADIDTALSNVANQNKLTLQQMQMALENDGLSFADFRNDMRRELKAEKIRNGLANQNVKVSEQEIDLFLADNTMDQSEVRLGHILVAVPADATEKDLKKTKAKVDKIYQKLQTGKEFSQVAIKYSSGQKALEGGDLGWRAITELPSLFADQIKVMKVGEFTHPVRSQSGFHIIKLTDRRQQGNKMITEYHARHILIKNSELVTPSQGMAMINEINTQLHEGADFEKLAEEKSDDTNSAPLGGDLGWFQVNALGKVFSEVMQNLDDEGVSSPFQTQAGWHIVQRLGTRESDITEDLKRVKAQRAIHARKMNEEIERWIAEIRGEAFIDIRI